jgi:hypothetical protein
MSTRGAVVIQHYHNGRYEIHYRHTDTYPTNLGIDLLEKMKAQAMFGKEISIDDLVKELGLEVTGHSVEKPEDAFLEYQGDLEWIYVIENPHDLLTTSVAILRTSCPDFWRMEKGKNRPDFTFRVWSSYLRFLSIDVAEIASKMRSVESMAEIALSAVASYHYAVKKMEARV